MAVVRRKTRFRRGTASLQRRLVERLECRQLLSGNLSNINIDVTGQGTLALANAATAATPPASVTFNGQVYSQQFDDEFNGTTLNTARWNTDEAAQLSQPTNGDQGVASFSDDIVSGGELHLAVSSAPAGTKNRLAQPASYLEGAVNSANLVLPPGSVFQWQGSLNWDHGTGWATSLTDANHANYIGEIDDGESQGHNGILTDTHFDPDNSLANIVSSPDNFIQYLSDGVSINPTEVNTYTAVYNTDGTVSFFVSPAYGPYAGQTFSAGTSDGYAFNPSDPNSTMALFFTVETDQNYGQYQANSAGITTTASAEAANGNNPLQPNDSDFAMNVNWVRVYSNPAPSPQIPVTASIVPVRPTSGPVNQIDINFNEPVTGLSLASLSLSDGTAGGNLLGSTQTLTTKNNQNYALSGLTPLTTGGGTYTLTLPSSSTIADVYGNALSTGATGTFVVIAAPIVAIAPVAPNPSPSAVDEIDFSFSEPVSGLSSADFSLTDPGGNSVLTGNETLTTSDNQNYELTGLSALTSASGTYTFSLSADPGVTDASGNSFTSGATSTFTISNGPAVQIASLPASNAAPVNQIGINFNEPVSGLSLASIALTRNGSVNLLTSSQTLTTKDNQHFVLGNVAGLTSSNTGYQISVSPSAGILDSAGKPLTTGTSETFSVAGPPTVAIQPVTPDPGSAPVNQVVITFSEPVKGFNLYSLAFGNGYEPNLLSSSAQTLATTDNQTFVLSGLTSLTNESGHYTITVIPGPGITDSSGRALGTGAQMAFTISVPPTVSFTPVSPNPRTTSVAQVAINFNEYVTGFDLSAISLTRNGSANLLGSTQTLTTTDGQHYTLGNLAGLTSLPGNYQLTIAPNAAIADILQNTLTTGAAVSFTVGSSPTATITPITPNPSYAPVNQAVITFSEPVTGVSLASFAFGNGYVSNLLSAAQTLTTTNNETYILSNLTPLTSASGHFTITLAPSSAIHESSGLSLTTGASTAFTLSITPTVSIVPVSPNPAVGGVSQISINFNQPVSGFSLSALSLTRNGAPVTLTGATLTSTNSQNFVIKNLTALTQTAASYSLSVNRSPAITDTIGNTLKSGATMSFSVIVPTTVSIAPVKPNPSATAISQITINFTAPVTGFSLSTLSLTRNGGKNLLTSAQTLTTTNKQQYVLGNLTALTSLNGAYTLTLTAGTSIKDGSGRTIASAAAATFTVSAPQVTLSALRTTGSQQPFAQIQITFSEPVTGLSLSSLTLTRPGAGNLLTSAQTLTTTNHQTYILGNLTGLFGKTTYGYTLLLRNTGITDSARNTLPANVTTSFVVV